MLLTKEVEITLHNQTIRYYENLGYHIPRYKNRSGNYSVKVGTKIIVKVKDLSRGSTVEVEVLCDYCKENIVKKPYYVYINSRKTVNKDCCNDIDCVNKKRKESHLILYGVDHYSKLDKQKEHMNNLLKLDQDFIAEEFLKANFILIGEYKNANIPVECICLNHIDKGIQKVRYNNIQSGNTKCCDYCSVRVRFGEDHWSWRGGITSENNKIRSSVEYIEWRSSVFRRDNYTCRCCNSSGNLQAHHIKNFSDNKDLRFDINNGVTLCKDCHKEFHSKYGKKNNDKSQLNEFIKKKVKS